MGQKWQFVKKGHKSDSDSKSDHFEHYRFYKWF